MYREMIGYTHVQGDDRIHTHVIRTYVKSVHVSIQSFKTPSCKDSASGFTDSEWSVRICYQAIQNLIERNNICELYVHEVCMYVCAHSPEVLSGVSICSCHRQYGGSC